MFRSGLSLLVLLGLATLGGCGSVNTLVRDDASAAHDLRLKATACTSLPRVYSGVSYTFCRLNVKTGSPAAPAQADGILEVLALDFALSGVIDTLALPYTSYRQYRDGNLSWPTESGISGSTISSLRLIPAVSLRHRSRNSRMVAVRYFCLCQMK